jgi:hypothetical protein
MLYHFVIIIYIEKNIYYFGNILWNYTCEKKAKNMYIVQKSKHNLVICYNYPNWDDINLKHI